MRRRPDAPNGESYVQATSVASTIWYMSGRQGPALQRYQPTASPSLRRAQVTSTGGA